MPKQFQDRLLNFVESGHIKVGQMRKQYDFKIKGATVVEEVVVVLLVLHLIQVEVVKSHSVTHSPSLNKEETFFLESENGCSRCYTYPSLDTCPTGKRFNA
jgi:hypothetical protein